MEFAGATLVFAVMHMTNHQRRPFPAGVRAGGLALGLVGLVGTMVLQYIGFASMPVIEANLVAYTWPLMTAAAVIVLGRPRRPLLLGLAAARGFVGVALVISGGRAQTCAR